VISGIRLLAGDYDGTLVKQGRLDAAVGAMLRQVVDGYRMFVVITGRPLESIRNALAANQLLGDGFPSALVCEERDIYIWDDGDYQPLLEHNQAATAAESALLSVTRPLAATLRDAWLPYAAAKLLRDDAGLKEFEQSQPAVEEQRGYVELRFGSVTAARAAQSWLLSHLPDNEPITAVRNNRLVSLRHTAFGKGAVLDVLRKHLGLRSTEVMAVGDSGNDLTMLNGSYGFHAAAVGNADAEVKAAVIAHNGTLLKGEAYEGIRELLELCGWTPDAVQRIG
jgi:HAD superfamily hydrolase (TIGR01484 family)